MTCIVFFLLEELVRDLAKNASSHSTTHLNNFLGSEGPNQGLTRLYINVKQ